MSIEKAKEPKCRTCGNTDEVLSEFTKKTEEEAKKILQKEGIIFTPENCLWLAERLLEACKKIDRLEAENKAQAEQIKELRKYVKHKDTCGIIGGYGYCNCGLEQALKETE